eukprot:g6113.t1
MVEPPPPGGNGNGPPADDGGIFGPGGQQDNANADGQPNNGQQGGAGGQQDEVPTDEHGFPTVANPLDDDKDNQVVSKSEVVKLSRRIPVPAEEPRNPYSITADTSRYVKFYCENIQRIGMEGTLHEFDEELVDIGDFLQNIGYDLDDPMSRLQRDANSDRVNSMGKYERRISDKRMTLQKIVDGLTQAEAILARDQEINAMGANMKRQEEQRNEMKLRLDEAAEREANPPATRNCLVCMKKTPELLDSRKEVRCVGCKNRGVCTDCWENRNDDCSKFFPDAQRPKHCFSCVTDKQSEEMELYCEEVQSACGTLQDADAKQIALDMPWFWKLSQARAEKPETVLAAYDLIRYPRMPRFLRKADDTAFKNLATAASAMQKSSHALIAGTMDKKIIASTYQHVGFKTLFGTTKKGAPDSAATNINLDSIEQFFRELADGYSKQPPPASAADAEKHPYMIAVYLCQEALFMIRCARDDYLGRTCLSFSDLSFGDRATLEQMIRCSIYVAMREDRKSLKKGSLLTKTERTLYNAKYVHRIRQLELRAVQKLAVTGSLGGGGGHELKALEKRMSSLQSTTDKLSNKLGGSGVRASLGDMGGGGDPNSPMFGNVATWDYDKVSTLTAYIEMKNHINLLSAEDKKVERKEWCSSAIRTNPKLVMYVFDTFRGRHVLGCRNCWAEKGGDPPMHAYTACRSLRSQYFLICPHCSTEHPEWPDACAAAPPRKSDANGGDGGGGRGNGGGKRGNGGGGNQKKNNRNTPYSKGGGGNKGSSNSTSRGDW